MTLVIDPKVALLKGVDPVQFCVFVFLGSTITERTVGVYMRQMGIRAQWVKPHTQTTV